MVWHAKARFGGVGQGWIGHCPPWRDVVWFGPKGRYGLTCSGSQWSGLVWYGSAISGMVWLGKLRRVQVRRGALRYG